MASNAGAPILPPERHQRALDLQPIASLLTRIKERYHAEQIWLFGSRARGDASLDSDWDLLVVVPDGIEERLLTPQVAWNLRKEAGIRADIIPCRASDFLQARDTVNTLSYEVAHEGVLLCDR
jgi:predicted nucleotidyltransferase